MERVNWAWRVIATGFCFSVFGIGGLFLSILVFPIQRLLIKEQAKRHTAARLAIHHTFRFFLNLMQVVGICRFTKQDAEQLNELKGKVIIGNHPSLIDVVVLIAHVKNADCIVKSHIWKNPFMRGVVESAGYISNADVDEMVKRCDASLKTGSNLIIFPEGTRTTPGQEIKFQRGAANIAVRCRSDFLPVHISVEPTTLTKSVPWYHVPPKKFIFNFKVMDCFSTSAYKFDDKVSLNVRRLTRDIEAYYKELVN